jgi:hypothetical protein
METRPRRVQWPLSSTPNQSVANDAKMLCPLDMIPSPQRQLHPLYFLSFQPFCWRDLPTTHSSWEVVLLWWNMTRVPRTMPRLVLPTPDWQLNRRAGRGPWLSLSGRRLGVSCRREHERPSDNNVWENPAVEALSQAHDICSKLGSDKQQGL